MLVICMNDLPRPGRKRVRFSFRSQPENHLSLSGKWLFKRMERIHFDSSESILAYDISNIPLGE